MNRSKWDLIAEKTWTRTSRRTGNRARKNNVFFFFKMSFSLQRNAHLYEPIWQNSRARIWQNSRFVRVLDTFHWINLIGAFIVFSNQALQRWNCFCWSRVCRFTYRHCQHFTYRRRSLLFEPHPTPLCIHRSNNTRDLCSIATYNVRSIRNVSMAPPPHPTPSCIHRSKNTRDLCSVATYNVRSTMNVSMPLPTPPHHDLRTHANKNVRFTSTVFGPLA